MPFLVPALVSGVSDALIVVVNRRRRNLHAQLLEHLAQLAVVATNSAGSGAEDDKDDTNSFSAVHHVQYLAIAAGIRLLLMVLPLSYHSYTGTAVRFYQCYRIFYGTSLAMVLLQMVALSVVDPGSLATLLPGGIPSGTPKTASQIEYTSFSGNATSKNDSEIMEDGSSGSWISMMASVQDMETSEVSRYAWWILLLSLLSISSHFIMLIHVRSTAPSLSSYYTLGKRNRRGKARLLYYYTSQNRLRSGSGNVVDVDDIESQLQQEQVPEKLQFPTSGSPAPKTPPPKSNPKLHKRQSESRNHSHNQLNDSEEQPEDASTTVSEFPPTSPIHKLSAHYDGTNKIVLVSLLRTLFHPFVF